jgi:hypothetical protein
MGLIRRGLQYRETVAYHGRDSEKGWSCGGVRSAWLGEGLDGEVLGTNREFLTGATGRSMDD